ncbi:unnamed protein product [Cuscuta campestris]|uniref:DUF4283 domain-containing protein n=1 Tax=Cuscuta campestris TaxID=132261 RepID=A0A484NGC7_9ASTE|nr:unnamed protein product [Cuscuta campestris]
MAGDQPRHPSHHLPDIKTNSEHPNFPGKATGKRQVEGGDLPSAAQIFPAVTLIGEAPSCSCRVPNNHTSPTPPAMLHLDAGNARSSLQPVVAVSDGLEVIPATSGQIDGVQPLKQVPGLSTKTKDPSISHLEADLENPQTTEIRVFSSVNPTIRRVPAKIVKKELHNRDPHIKTKPLALVSSNSAPVTFPATAARAPPAAAAPATGKKPEPSVPLADAKKPAPSLAQVVYGSKRISLPTFVTEPLPDREVTIHRGLPAVRFNESEVSDLALIDKYILVGKFSHGQPKLEVIKAHFATNYVFRGSVSA